MSEERCKKCGARLIPNPQRLDAFMCGKCGAKYDTVWKGNDPIAGVG